MRERRRNECPVAFNEDCRARTIGDEALVPQQNGFEATRARRKPERILVRPAPCGLIPKCSVSRVELVGGDRPAAARAVVPSQ
jgi:hypothetical protein